MFCLPKTAWPPTFGMHADTSESPADTSENPVDTDEVPMDTAANR